MIKWLVIGMFLSNQVFDAVIQYLNNAQIKKALPENVRDVYDEAEYERWKNYNRESRNISLINNIISMCFVFFVLLFNVYAKLFYMFWQVPDAVKYLFVIAILSLINSLITLPCNYYDNFVIEEKYGFNKRTKKLYFIDKLKSYLIGVMIQFVFVMLVYVLYERFGNLAFLWASLVVLGVVLIFALIVVPLMKIFNKFTPLEEGDLKDKLLELCDKYKVEIKRIVVKDASKRTTRANAFCSGYGKRKTISLDDNLVNGYSSEQIVAVFAHEFAHARGKHFLKNIPFVAANLVIIFAALGLVLNTNGLYESFGFSEVNYLLALEVQDWIMWPLNVFISITANYLSRKHEYEADTFAAKEGYGENLISCLKKLSKESLSDINPHPAVVALHYSHPTLSQRISAIRKIKNNY